jgi:putative acetyltransferase
MDCGTSFVIVRNEGPEDANAIRRLNTEAFGQPREAELVDALRDHCDDVLSLVAVDGDDIVGHTIRAYNAVLEA